MIYTVTLNPALDKTLSVSELRPGEVQRPASSILIWAARASSPGHLPSNQTLRRLPCSWAIHWRPPMPNSRLFGNC